MNTDNRKLNTRSNFAFASGTGQVPKPKESATPPSLRGLRIAHLGTYPPRQCGIATYTQDVVSALHANTEVDAPIVVAMVAPDENPIQTGYGWPVRHLIRQDHPEEYREIARALKSSGTDLINIQYEHGIFGGSHGDMLNEFLDEIAGAIPVTVTFHTVLPNPDPELARALREVALRVDEMIVLNSRAIPLLKNAYNIPTHNVSVIPHGTPNVERSRRPLVREQFGVEDQMVLSTFGLISPGKGLEHAIEAVSKIADTHPNLHYYILGATHPGIVRHSGESYREGLIQLAEELGVPDRIHFVNRYLTLDELTDWLLATDIYVTPYLNPDQIVSGTLAYAVAAGKPVVSTPYLHAQELLENGRGVLTPFRDPQAMADNLASLIDNPAWRVEMSKSAWAFGRTSVWSEVAHRYGEVFASALHKQQLLDVETEEEETLASLYAPGDMTPRVPENKNAYVTAQL